MTTIDLSPLYRNSIGFERLASLLDNAFQGQQTAPGYPPYDIEALDESRYSITLAVAGFREQDLEIQVEGDLLTIKGNKGDSKTSRNYLYQGIAARAFERKFNLADHVEITAARLADGLLTIELKHELPESLKPRQIKIDNASSFLEHKDNEEQAA